ncbi:serine/threonine-protein kinase [Coleofasciculus sp. FACHB-1120]|uniref:protein kinase domain-containing protein n=1 Tax=Coleofasciculus sp. FACHB-1120 TaxID=2692783 RepID=UPI001683BFCA|nr:serine/threonine protein kinase [Coleofasciculus sp. FACHB-1120]
MSCCLNPDCQNPLNPDTTKFCRSCGTKLMPLLRGHYRIIQLISNEGGFGRTYLAEDIDKMNELCVVKQFRPQVQGTAALNKSIQLFKQEAKRLQEMGHHPQIPTLYGYFEEGNYLYLVQQFIDGQDLLQELEQQGAFSESQIREMLLDILPVLKFVHDQKIIHRDIKPENIMRRRLATGGKQELVLIDFGAAKQLTAKGATQRGTKIGSFGYTSYEQMQGGEVSPASDLFSLGVTCFHLLSNYNPHSLFLDYGYDWVGQWRKYLKHSISRNLGNVLDKLLQKNIDFRYHSVDEIIQDLMYKPPNVTPTVFASPKANKSFKTTAIPSTQVVKKNFNNQFLAGSSTLLLALVGYGYFNYLNLNYYAISNQILSPGSQNFSEKFAFTNTLRGHLKSVASVAISPDGEMLASGSLDNTIKLWNLNTGQEISTLNGHSKSVGAVAISPDGQTLASGSWDNTIRLWNIKKAYKTRTLAGHSSQVVSVAFSPNGEILASSSLDNTIKLWDLKTGQEINTFTGHSNWVMSIAFSPDGQTLASGSWDNTVKLWNIKTGDKIRTLTGHSNHVNSVAFSPDGQMLASGSWDNTVKLWNVNTGQEIRTLHGHSKAVYSVRFSPDMQTLASGGMDNTIKLWNPNTGRERYSLEGHFNNVVSLAFSGDGRTLASGSQDFNVKIWRIE